MKSDCAGWSLLVPGLGSRPAGQPLGIALNRGDNQALNVPGGFQTR